jgi:hypothetical protein
MPTYNLTIDHETGSTRVVSRDGRRHSMDALAAAQRAAADGDAEAAALLQSVDFGVGDDGAVLDEAGRDALVEKIIHDCPECRAARARGEEPRVYTREDLARLPLPPPELAALLEDAARDLAFGSRDDAPIAWRPSDLVSFGPGPHRRRHERRRERARRRRLFA